MKATEQSTHANDYLNQHLGGSDGLINYIMGFCVTSGAYDLADTNGAFWLLDVICSHQLSAKVRAEGFQVWKLKKNKTGDGCKIICEDGNNNIVVTQAIPYTDFKYQSAVLWLVDKVIMLPIEY